MLRPEHPSSMAQPFSCDSVSLHGIAGLKHVLSEFVLRQACPERRSCFDRLSTNGVKGLRTHESKGPAPPRHAAYPRNSR